MISSATVVGDLVDVDETNGSVWRSHNTQPPTMVCTHVSGTMKLLTCSFPFQLNGYAHAATVENSTGGSVTVQHQLNPNQVECNCMRTCTYNIAE